MNKGLNENSSTAQNRLVKDLLFSFIVSSESNVCYHCNKPMSREDFSIEHKVPWRHAENAVDLFYNIDNIAYSHQSCNYSAARHYTLDMTDDERAARKRNMDKLRYAKYREAEKSLSTEETEVLRTARRIARREKYLRTGN